MTTPERKKQSPHVRMRTLKYLSPRREAKNPVRELHNSMPLILKRYVQNLKTGVPQGIVSSNLTASARQPSTRPTVSTT
jgi:hypothetical protein